MRRILSGLDPRWVSAASHRICASLQELLESRIRSQVLHVLGFSAFFPGEVDISGFLRSQLGARAVYLPCCDPQRSVMTFCSISAGHDLKRGAFGISEPERAVEREYNSMESGLSVVLVPGLAFDRQGNRLGRGKGFYDRYLANLPTRPAALIGIGWSLQVLPKITPQQHDVPLDWIVHEQGMLQTKRV